jgi:redox-sensitive bicupin YhaK (pirin superfamily)
MIAIRRAHERGHANHGWLDTYHTFSFASYHDPRHMGFRALRVMNEDFVAAGQGFGTHPHHEVLRPGEFQRMSAGTGITHSEFNPSASEPVHLYQIWLFPDHRGIDPSYEQRRFPQDERHNRLRLVASPNATDGSLLIHQDARIYLSSLDDGTQLDHAIANGRHAWLQVLRGQVSLMGQVLHTSDGAAISEEPQLSIAAEGDAEILLFDLA